MKLRRLGKKARSIAEGTQTLLNAENVINYLNLRRPNICGTLSRCLSVRGMGSFLSLVEFEIDLSRGHCPHQRKIPSHWMVIQKAAHTACRSSLH